MVHLYPPTLTELRQSRIFVPESEKKVFKITEALSSNWHVWHSVTWDCDTKRLSGEADLLFFHKDYGFVVMEIKGGIISIEDGIFYSINQANGKKNKIKDPFRQARTSMYHIKDCYVKLAKKQENSGELLTANNLFPLNFDYAVIFPDSPFKDEIDYVQYSNSRIFDSIDYENQIDQMMERKYSQTELEKFLINLLDLNKSRRIKVPGIGNFFPKFIGANVYHYLSTKKYLNVREIELRRVNKLQDYLLMALSEKKRCIFKGSAGSGKTFIAMKAAINNYHQDLKTLFLCYNKELRQSVRSYLSQQLSQEYGQLQSRVAVFSIIQFLYQLSNQFFFSQVRGRLNELLNGPDPPYDKISKLIQDNYDKIPDNFKYDAIIIDEAQDIDKSIWDIIALFLKDQDDSLLYVFYDEDQTIFKDHFSPEGLGCDAKKDVIVLKKNLRNSIEIAKCINLLTGLGQYDEFSGINGFKISRRKFSNPKKAIIKTLIEIKKYLKNEITSKEIAILSHKKLKNLDENASSNELCDYLYLKEADGERSIIITEPKDLSSLSEIAELFNTDQLAVLKTIASFKGLERDIVFLIYPCLKDYKRKYPNYFEDFKKQIYVGMSRAKFKLHLMEYSF